MVLQRVEGLSFSDRHHSAYLLYKLVKVVVFDGLEALLQFLLVEDYKLEGEVLGGTLVGVVGVVLHEALGLGVGVAVGNAIFLLGLFLQFVVDLLKLVDVLIDLLYDGALFLFFSGLLELLEVIEELLQHLGELFDDVVYLGVGDFPLVILLQVFRDFLQEIVQLPFEVVFTLGEILEVHDVLSNQVSDLLELGGLGSRHHFLLHILELDLRLRSLNILLILKPDLGLQLAFLIRPRHYALSLPIDYLG